MTAVYKAGIREKGKEEDTHTVKSNDGCGQNSCRRGHEGRRQGQ